MSETSKSYATANIEVSFDSDVCIHSAECLRNLPDVFKLRRRPWIRPELATADEVADTIDRCPSGALTYRRIE